MLKKQTVERPEITCVGIQVRTSFETELEEGKIGPCVQSYFHQGLFDKIPHRNSPGTTFCAYTDYESDYRGGYTYFIGEEVTSIDELPEEFTVLNIPFQSYAKFTSGPASMPGVVRGAWQEIWEMTPQELGGERRYHTDFEIYDERAVDHHNVILDLYIGIGE